MFETDWRTLAELQNSLLIFAGDAVCPELARLALGDVLGQTQELRAHGDLLDVGQHNAALAGQSYWYRI